MKVVLQFGLILLFAGLAACAPATGETDPSDTVEQYLQAKVESNEDVVRDLLCSEMEADLAREAGSFRSVEASIEDMACEQAGENLVRCEGQIAAVYGTENTEFPLGEYRVVQEDGEWKWCGEAE